MKTKLSYSAIVPGTSDALRSTAQMRKRWASSASALAIMTAALAVPQGATAQDQAAKPEQTQEIVVTGSRIARSTFNSPTPLTVINSELIQKEGQINVAETVKVIPQNVAAISDTNTGINGATVALNVGAQIANLRGLNPTTAIRTLTLVDTKRFVPTTTGGAVDLNLIPSLLVQRVETVTGGASAAYGTDALAGVVNIILDKGFTGIKGQGDWGQTTHGDGQTYHGALALGTDLFGGRAHTIFGVEYEHANKVGDCTDVRDWCALSPDTFTNEGYLTNGQNHYIRGFNGAYTNYNTTLVFRGSTLGARTNPAALRNITFDSTGTAAVPFDPGQYAQAVGFFDRSGGTCAVVCSVWAEDQLRPSINRLALFSHTDFDIIGTMKGSFEGSYGRRGSQLLGLDLGPSSATPIRTDNAFIPAALAAQIAAAYPYAGNAGGASAAPGVPDPIFIAKSMKYVPGARNDNNTSLDTFHFNVGLQGDLEWLKGWTWNGYYQYGKTESDQIISGIRVNSFFTYAIDAVRDSSGNIVCRATLPGPANTLTVAGNYSVDNIPFQLWNDPNAAGCVPLNMFGSNTENAAAIAYAYRTATEHNTYEQHVIAGNLNGDLFEGWAGPFKAALGGEYRYEIGSTTHNKLPFNGQFSQNAFGADYGGELSILEGYAEVDAPLLKDLPFVQLVDLDAAFRQTQQTNTDDITGNSKDLSFNTWKFSATWDVNDWVRFRGTLSQDVRAAGYRDLYYNQDVIPAGPPAGTVFNPSSTAAVRVNDAANILYPPNFKLDPEEGKTTTFGVVFKGQGWLDGLQVSADYYRIHIAKAIATLTAQQTMDACTSSGSFCNNIIVSGGGKYNPALGSAQDITDVIIGANNIGAFVQQGYDFELDYHFDLDRVYKDLPGSISWRTIATYVPTFLVTTGPGAKPLNYAGQDGGAAYGGFTSMPPYIITQWLTFDNGPFSATVDLKYIPTGIYDITRHGPDDKLYTGLTDPNGINSNKVQSRLYVGLATSYKFLQDGDHSLEGFATIRNLFDSDPPPTASAAGGGPVSGVGAPTNPVYFDTLGRQFRVGLRFKY